MVLKKKKIKVLIGYNKLKIFNLFNVYLVWDISLCKLEKERRKKKNINDCN